MKHCLQVFKITFPNIFRRKIQDINLELRISCYLSRFALKMIQSFKLIKAYDSQEPEFE